MRARRSMRPADDYTVPHLKQLFEDEQMSGVVYYSISQGEIHIGRKTGDPVP